MAKKEVVIPTNIIAILYTDGSFKSNNKLTYTEGFVGSGIHGYLYSSDDEFNAKLSTDRPDKIYITDTGYSNIYMPNSKTKLVNPICYIDGIVSSINKGSAPIGELNAIYYGLKSILDLIESEDEKYAFSKNIIKVMLYIDSSYCIDVLEKYNTVDINPNIPNADIIKSIYNLITKLKELDITIQPIKIKGHSGDYGNDTADRLSFIGRTLSSTREQVEIIKYTIPPEKYWKIDTTRSPLLSFKQLFFTNAVRANASEIIYAILDYPTDTIPGIKSSNACFGLVIPKLYEDYIEAPIREYHKLAKYTEHFNVISTLNLLELYSRNNIHFYSLGKASIYNYNYRNGELSNVLNTSIVYPVRPPSLAIQTLDKMQLLYNFIKYYKENANINNITFIDITDKFYNITKDKKGNDKYSCTIPNGTNFDKYTVTYKDKDLVIPIDFGKDTLTRNTFKALESDRPKVILVILQESDAYIKYFTIVDTKTYGIGIYCNLYSNTILLKEK